MKRLLKRHQPVNEHQLNGLAKQLAEQLSLSSHWQWPLLIELQGPMGAGKTTFVRSLLQALGHQGSVKSPTFAVLEPYPELLGGVYHWDLYRLSDPEELEYLGFRDYWTNNSCFLIEWADKAKGYLPEAQIVIELEPLTDTTRCVTFTTV